MGEPEQKKYSASAVEALLRDSLWRRISSDACRLHLVPKGSRNDRGLVPVELDEDGRSFVTEITDFCHHWVTQRNMPEVVVYANPVWRDVGRSDEGGKWRVALRFPEWVVAQTNLPHEHRLESLYDGDLEPYGRAAASASPSTSDDRNRSRSPRRDDDRDDHDDRNHRYADSRSSARDADRHAGRPRSPSLIRDRDHDHDRYRRRSTSPQRFHHSRNYHDYHRDRHDSYYYSDNDNNNNRRPAPYRSPPSRDPYYQQEYRYHDTRSPSPVRRNGDLIDWYRDRDPRSPRLPRYGGGGHGQHRGFQDDGNPNRISLPQGPRFGGGRGGGAWRGGRGHGRGGGVGGGGRGAFMGRHFVGR